MARRGRGATDEAAVEGGVDIAVTRARGGGGGGGPRPVLDGVTGAEADEAEVAEEVLLRKGGAIPVGKGVAGEVASRLVHESIDKEVRVFFRGGGGGGTGLAPLVVALAGLSLEVVVEEEEEEAGSGAFLRGGGAGGVGFGVRDTPDADGDISSNMDPCTDVLMCIFEVLKSLGGGGGGTGAGDDGV